MNQIKVVTHGLLSGLFLMLGWIELAEALEGQTFDAGANSEVGCLTCIPCPLD